MTLSIRHVVFPVPTFIDLAVAIGRIPSVRAAIGPLIVSWIGFFIAPWGWWDAGVPVVFCALGILLGWSIGPITRDWHAVRRRRLFLNAADARFDRSARLVETLESLIKEAAAAWQRYVAEATVGSTQSSRDDGADRHAVELLERLSDVRSLADRFGIMFDGEPADDGVPRLPVPPIDAFAPVPPSVTMAGFNAAAMVAVKAQAMAQAAQRHRRMLAAAALHEPYLLFAQDALRAVADTMTDPSCLKT